MKAQKVIVKIEVETLSVDSVQSVIAEAASGIARGVLSGEVVMDDGDTAIWETKFKDVQF